MAVRRLAVLGLTEAERDELAGLAARRSTAQALALRARIVLGCAAGEQNKQVAARLGVSPATVTKWRRRFVEQRVEGLRDEPRSGAPRTIDDARIEAVIVKTLESLPPDATHWSSRGMAKPPRSFTLAARTGYAHRQDVEHVDNLPSARKRWAARDFGRNSSNLSQINTVRPSYSLTVFRRTPVPCRPFRSARAAPSEKC